MSLLTHEEIEELLVEVQARDRICVKAADDGKCSRKHDPHHIVTQRTLERHLSGEELERALRDARNLVYICRLHHNRVHAGTMRLDEALLRQIGFYEFLEEFNLTALWEGIVAKQLPTHRRVSV